jgi:Tn3 transposase DDE domain
LRDRLRAGDVWVEGSRQYRDFDAYLIPKPTFALLKAEGPLPIEVDPEFTSYIAARRAALDRELAEVAGLARAGKLPDVNLSAGELKVAPLRGQGETESKALRAAAYDVLPRVKITDLLLEVDAWTDFSAFFTHQRNGRPAENRMALLTAVLADGINLGLTRMADTCRGVTLRQLAWVHDWHIREDAYGQALARLIDTHRAMPLARLWGDGVRAVQFSLRWLV